MKNLIFYAKILEIGYVFRIDAIDLHHLQQITVKNIRGSHHRPAVAVQVIPKVPVNSPDKVRALRGSQTRSLIGFRLR